MGEHPGEGDLGFLFRSGDRGTWTRLCWCSGGCRGSVLFAALGFAMWHLLLFTSFVKGCRRAGWPGTPSVSPKLGKGPLDEEREGGRRNASLERRSGKCCELIRAGLACLDKPRWACKALNPGRTTAYGSCAVGFTGICFQQAARSQQSLLFAALAVARILPSSGQQHLGSPLGSTPLPRLSGDWS